MSTRTGWLSGGRLIPLAFGVLVVVGLALTAWVGVRGVLAQQHLETARTIAADIDVAAISDPAQATDAIDRLADGTNAARALTSDPVWRLYEGLPWLGPQLRAVSTLTASLDETVSEAVEPIVAQVQEVGVDAFAPRDGAFDAAAFAELQEPARAGAEKSRHAAESVHGIDREALLPVLGEPVDDASALLDGVAEATDALARATALLPKALGAEGPRDYLVLFQNNAEWRSLGGLVGSMAVMHTEGGRVSLTDQGGPAELGYHDPVPIPFDDEVLSVYGDRPGRYPGNVTQLADFTIAAPLEREYWRAATGLEVDGVVAVDPVALSYLLRAIGPVDLPTGDVLTADNAVQLLLNDVYLRYDDPAEQNAFFDAATAAVFGAFLSRPIAPAPLLAGLGQAASENRVFVWSAAEDEQRTLEGTTLRGDLPITDATTSRFGVYVNDGTGSKMDYYARLETDAAWCGVLADGRSSAALRVTLRSEAPADIAAYTRHITGGGGYGVDAGLTRTVAYIYLPEGATLLSSDATADTRQSGAEHRGRSVVVWTSDLAAGASATIDVRVAAASTPRIGVQQTATLGEGHAPETVASCGE